MAFGDGIAHFPTAFAALLGAILIHIITNLTNDYCDLKKGADKKGDFDPMRSILVGSISQKEIKSAIDVALLCLIPICIYLISRAGWPIFVIAFLSLLSAIFYTAGKKPLGYQGFGDILVLLFFGPIAVGGTYYAQTLEINAAVVLAGFGPGLLAMSILAINNVRDFETDKQVNKKTLVVRFGKTFGRIEYALSLTLAALIPIIIYLTIHDHKIIIFSSVILLGAIFLIRRSFIIKNKPDFDQLIGLTVQLCLFYGIIFSIGWIAR